MSEKEIKTMSENKEVSPSPEKKKNKSFLVIYSIALFLFAAVLIHCHPPSGEPHWSKDYAFTMV